MAPNDPISPKATVTAGGLPPVNPVSPARPAGLSVPEKLGASRTPLVNLTSAETPYAVQPDRRDPSDGIWKYMAGGLVAVVLLVGGAGGWAATTNISGAVIAGGTVVVESSVKKVQHASGGVVGEIKVKEGDHVKDGDLLVRLDETITRANLEIVAKQLDEMAIRKARLIAERDRAREMIVPPSLLERMADPEISEIVRGEKTLFASRRKAMAGQKKQLLSRVSQFKNEITGLEAQEAAKGEEIKMIRKELEGLAPLQKKRLVTVNRITTMKREALRIVGERARLISDGAQTRGRITETELQILQIDSNMESEVIKEMREIQAREGELRQRLVAAKEQLSRIDIRAPRDGIVHQLSVHTIGGFVNQGEQLMLIVPENDNLVIEVRVAPQDIANVHYKQLAYVRFTAFNQRTTPEFNGEVVRIAADLTLNEQGNAAYYKVRIILPPSELDRLGDLKLLPGMPVEVHIKTTDRTALSYLMRPLRDQMKRVFKQD